YTSGSTGKPKGVMIEHGSLTDKLITESAIVKADHSIITILTTNYVFDASLLEIFLPLMWGGKITIPLKEIIFSAEGLANFLFQNKVNILQATPGFLQHVLLGLKTDKNLASHLNQLCIGGESLTNALVKEVNEILPHAKLNNHYGPTESTIDAIVFDGVKKLDKNFIGKPIANTTIYITDEHHKPAPKGVVGEICIGGRGLARGYLNSAQLTKEKFISSSFKAGERLYKTGDQGRWTEDGNIEFIGRKDDQVKIRGNRIELGEIEAALNEHKDLEQAVVMVNEIREEKILQAYVVPKLSQPEFWPSMGEYPVYDEVLYFAMTHDEKRVSKYKNAISQMVQGKSVVEIGTGKDAILARLCVEAGATIVYAIEIGKEAYEQAKVLIRQLGYEEKIILIFGDALQVNLPEPVDICVSEIIGTIGGSKGAVAILNNARRFLKKDGVMIPEKCVTKIAAVCLPDKLYNTPVFGEMGDYYVDQVFEKTGHPFDIRLCIKNISKQNIISTHAIIEDLHFDKEFPEQYSEEFNISITKNSRFDGFLSWINLYPAAGELIDSLEHETSWLPVYFPVFYPGIELVEGTIIKGNFDVRLSKNGINPDYKIKGAIISADGSRIDFEYDS
ncbi:MAG: AMP-binding protein, partial [Chitinophagaceae bacterium]